MPTPSPFHERTQPLCTSYRWKDWAGYHAVCSYDICHEREYNAFRQAAGLLDVTPLFKYDVSGPDSAAFLSRITVRNIAKLKVGRVVYLCWTDDHGKILDDGTCAHIEPGHYRLTSAAPSFHWLERHSDGFDIKLEDRSRDLAALALQGPTSRRILEQLCGADLRALKFFGVEKTQFDGMEGVLTRTGYTGDLGYELWVENKDALRLWDAVMAAGKSFGIHPAGLDALDVCRVEAGFILQGVDYISAQEALIPSQHSTPFELGLGWTVKLKNRDPFVGQQALEAEKAAGSAWGFVGLELDWEALEAAFSRYNLPPQLPHTAWRSAIPVYRGRKQVGRATSGAWSPVLKKNLALATVEATCAKPGTILDVELTVEWERRTVPATVVKTPFFDPPRKKAHGQDV
jgi:aminomethyltransferase